METVTSRRLQLKSDDNYLSKICNNSTNNSSNSASGHLQKHTQNSIPKRRQDLLSWSGWGYKDFHVSFNCTTGHFQSTNERYPMNYILRQPVREWIIKTLDMDLMDPTKQENKDEPPNPNLIPRPIINKDFLAALKSHNISHSTDGEDRYFRSHGHALDELWKLREQQQIQRIPDLIVWPDCHDQVVLLVELANTHNVVIIPYGGGTSVTKGLQCNPQEMRMIVSLDTSQMNRVLWVDKVNLVACCEAGIIGQDLGRELEKHGLTTGHEPDSYEFSSLGGWVATRASGMKKNLYGNIEDLVVHVRFVTPTGVLEKQNNAPRISCGPDFNQIVLGSEGTLGVVTEVMLKVRPIPECREVNSLVFPTFTLGVNFMQDVARKRYQPASLRLIDNEQYQMGKIYQEDNGYFGQLIDALKMVYLTKYMGIDESLMCIVIAVFEGDKEEVQIEKGRIQSTAQKYKGFFAGAKNGERGYKLTFTIAYVRDICFQHDVIAESFETSVPWDRCVSLCRNIKSIVAKECKAKDIKFFQISCRVTQVYDTGTCVYFYFVFNTRGIQDAVLKYEQIEAVVRDEILACGGSISHHHGVGKVRRRWFPQQVSSVGVDLYRAIKKQLDPNNIFASGNLLEEN